MEQSKSFDKGSNKCRSHYQNLSVRGIDGIEICIKPPIENTCLIALLQAKSMLRMDASILITDGLPNSLAFNKGSFLDQKPPSAPINDPTIVWFVGSN